MNEDAFLGFQMLITELLLRNQNYQFTLMQLIHVCTTTQSDKEISSIMCLLLYTVNVNGHAINSKAKITGNNSLSSSNTTCKVSVWLFGERS